MTRTDRGTDRGAAAVEFALVMPLLLLILFAIIDFGRMLNTQITLTEAAREGARAAAYSQSVSTRVAAATGNMPGVLTTTTACSASSEFAQVELEVPFEFITPFAAIAQMFGSSPSGAIDLSAKGVMACAAS
jgi:Flp pilus assembly protein TadG